jgi:HprK-related kinase A
MRTLSSLSRAELAARLAADGLRIGTGGFVTRVVAPLPQVADALHLLYADYPLLEQPGMSDFHVSLAPSAGIRRWYRPQVNFLHDGQALFEPLPRAHAYPMFEWCLNWCVSSRAHSYLMIHAAVAERGGRAVILPAPPGSGKSTLCAALVNKGWRLLSDELALVRLEDGMLVPLPRPISLKNGSIDVIREYVIGAVFSESVHDTTKGTVAYLKAPRSAVQRSAEAAMPAWLVFPRYQAGSPTVLEPMARPLAFMILAENAFNYSVLGQTGFTAMARLIEQVQAFRFVYSELDEALNLFDRMAEQS